MNIILKTIFGSHLYGLNTENSDTDYKGIYLPTKKQILLSTAPAVCDLSTKQSSQIKNTKDDTDFTIYSLSKFVHLACCGDAVAIDMLHSSENLCGKNEIWDYLHSNRTKFYSKNMSAYAGYVKKQCAKYGIKGSKLSELNDLIKILFTQSLTTKIRDFELPNGTHCFYTTKLNKSTQIEENFYNVNGKLISVNCQLRDVYGSATFQYDKYGERARLAQQNSNVDWKAVSHALRVSYQLYDIYTKGDFSYPLDQSQYIIDVKTGKIPYDNVVEVLEQMVDTVTGLSLRSSLPDEVDVEYWDDFVADAYESIVCSS